MTASSKFTRSGLDSSARNRESLPPHLLAAALDQIDYGAVVVNANATVIFANRSAQLGLEGQYPLIIADGRLAVRDRSFSLPFDRTLENSTQRGLCSMMRLPNAAGRDSFASFVPLGDGTALIILERDDNRYLAIQLFGMKCGLTSTEIEVLQLLTQGLTPKIISEKRGVSGNTTQGQILAVRKKTGSRSITELVRRVASVPPMVSPLNSLIDYSDEAPPRPRSQSDVGGVGMEQALLMLDIHGSAVESIDRLKSSYLNLSGRPLIDPRTLVGMPMEEL